MLESLKSSYKASEEERTLNETTNDPKKQQVDCSLNVMAEHELVEKELHDFKFALDASSIVAITNEKGIITYVNEQFTKISGYSKDELIGKDHRVINSSYHSKEFFRHLWRTIQNGEVWKGEIKNRAKNGHYYWVDTTIVPFLNETGQPYQFLSIRYEITKRKEAEEQLQKIMTKMMDVQEEERRRISRNLHDGIGQNIYSHLITINLLQSQIQHPLLEQLQKEASELIDECRRISQELRPSVLDDLGLLPAIRSYLLRFSEFNHMDIHFDCSLDKRLASQIEVTIYRIIQEALINIQKYAQTNKAMIIIREMGENIRVLIEDEGIGFDPTRVSRGVGLFSMEERAKSVGGKVQVISTPGKGTKIILDIPLK